MSSLTSPTRKLLTQDLNFANFEQRIYFMQTYMPSNGQKQNFFHAYFLDNGQLIHQGYIYFYLDEEKRKSRFIGAYVDPKYRGNGLCSLLISCWLKTLLEANYTFFDTNKRQRKPFLLYQLKQFSFEINDINKYNTNPNTIYICQKDHKLTKYLYFKNPGQRLTFTQGKIMQHDNYEALEVMDEQTKILDQILLSDSYFLQDENKAYTRSLKTIQKHSK